MPIYYIGLLDAQNYIFHMWVLNKSCLPLLSEWLSFVSVTLIAKLRVIFISEVWPIKIKRSWCRKFIIEFISFIDTLTNNNLHLCFCTRLPVKCHMEHILWFHFFLTCTLLVEIRLCNKNILWFINIFYYNAQLYYSQVIVFFKFLHKYDLLTFNGFIYKIFCYALSSICKI